MRCFWLYSILLVHTVCSASRLQPLALKYQGAFKLPAGFNYNGGAMTYYPDGDAGGGADGYPGSIFSIGHAHHGLYAEIAIPKPVKTKNFDQLPVARQLQDFADLNAVFPQNGWSGQRVAGIEYLPAQGKQKTGKLYLSYGDSYTIQPGQLSFAWADPNLKNPAVKGPWDLVGQNKHCLADFMFEIPQSWASAHTQGMRLVTGRYRNGSWCGHGPALIALGPWTQGDPPPANSGLHAKVLMQYDTEHEIENFNRGDKWSGGAWLESNGSSAVVLAGRKGVGGDNYGIVCGEKGYYADGGYQPGLLFFDPDGFAQVLAGTSKTYEPQPYTFLDVNGTLLFPNTDKCGKNQLASLAYDRTRNLLYGMEAMGSKTIVHVWKVESEAVVGETPVPFLGEPLSKSGKKYEWDRLEAGKKVYVDSDCSFSQFPENFRGLDYLRTADEDRTHSAVDFLQFESSEDITLYVGYASDKPSSWMSDWSPTHKKVMTTVSELFVFSKRVPKGTVKLGGNEGAASMYSLWTDKKEAIAVGSIRTSIEKDDGESWTIQTTPEHVYFEYSRHDTRTGAPVLEVFDLAQGRRLYLGKYTGPFRLTSDVFTTGAYIVRYRNEGESSARRFNWLQP